MQMVMTPDEAQIQILANWPMSLAKRVTRDNWKNPEYRVIAAIRGKSIEIVHALSRLSPVEMFKCMISSHNSVNKTYWRTKHVRSIAERSGEMINSDWPSTIQ